MSEKEDIEVLKEKVEELLKKDNSVDEGKILQAFIENKDGENLFSFLLRNYVHAVFSEEEAIEHWKHIVLNSEELSKKLERPVGITLALVDYFTNENRIFDSPLLVEVHIFKQTEKLAMVDGLTGVFNRRYMDVSLKKEKNRCDRYEKKFSVLIIDIDDFKKFNDIYGHLFGDRVLQITAQTIREGIRNEDVLCRYGGEEFLVILPETDIEGAEFLGNRLCKFIREKNFLAENKITVSVGVATYPDFGDTEEKVIGEADKALYKAKKSGKNCCCRTSV